MKREAKVGGHVAKEKRRDEGNAREKNRCRRGRERYGALGKRGMTGEGGENRRKKNGGEEATRGRRKRNGGKR